MDAQLIVAGLDATVLVFLTVAGSLFAPDVANP